MGLFLLIGQESRVFYFLTKRTYWAWSVIAEQVGHREVYFSGLAVIVYLEL
jgi:hypothetical protein